MSEPYPPTSNPAGPSGGGWPDDEPSDPSVPQVSAVARLWKVLVSPEETFRAIAARPSWGLALVVLLVGALCVGFLAAQKIDYVEVMRERMESQGKPMPPGVERWAGVMKGFGIAAPGIATLVIPLIFAAIYLALNLMGGRLRFGASYSVVLHSGMPSLLKGLLSIPVILGRASLSLKDAQGGFLKSSAAAFAPEGAGPRLMAILASLDLFTIWSLILTIIGLSVAAKVSKATSALFVIATWALFTLLFVFLAGFGSA